MTRDLGDHRDVGAGAGKNDLVHPLHGAAGQPHQGLDACAGLPFDLIERDDDAQELLRAGKSH